MGILQRQRALRRRGYDPLASRVIRPNPDVRPDTYVRYDAVVAGDVDRAEWAKFINELLDETPKRNKAALARRIDFRERTIDRWLRGDTGVDEASVRKVADRTGRNPVELLIRLGVYSRDEMPEPVIPPEDEWIVRLIQSSTKLSQVKKNALIAVELAKAQRERDEKRRHLDEQIDILAGPSDDDE